MGSSGLQQIAGVLKVDVSYFFEGISVAAAFRPARKASSSDYIAEFVKMSDGIRLIRAFTRITDKNVRRQIATLVASIAK